MLDIAAAKPVYTVPQAGFGATIQYGLALAPGDTARCDQLSESLRNILSDGRWETVFASAFPGVEASEHKPSLSKLTACGQRVLGLERTLVRINVGGWSAHRPHLDQCVSIAPVILLEVHELGIVGCSRRVGAVDAALQHDRHNPDP